ncbi:MAG: ABC transporter substrate-binding protein [Elusimicrobia bacterium]|nr:ABC transporter substrate-binding protein [Elusimicrobiota bacterium]
MVRKGYAALAILAVFLVAALSACGKRDAEPGPAPAPTGAAAVPNKDTYIHATIQDIDSMDPAWAYDSASHSILLNVYEPLVTYKGSSTSELEPVIAQQVPSRANGLVSADGRTYTFPIRKGVKFHHGATLTPEDVRYSLMRFMLYDRAGGPSSLLLEPVTGLSSTRDEKGKVIAGVYDKVAAAVTVQGDSVQLKLHKPFAPILTVLASWGLVVAKDSAKAAACWDGSKEDWEKHNNPQKTSEALHDRPDGTGPFKLERWDSKGKEIVLSRFEGYWRGPARLKTVVIRGIDEFQTRKLMLAAGDADSIYADRLSKPLLESIDGVELIDDLPRIDMNPTVFFVFKIETQGNPNIGSGKLDGEGIPGDFFADKDVRLAFAHAFDADGFIKDVNRGKGSRATGFIPKGLLGHNPDQPVYAYDLKKAEAHFKKAFGGKLWEKGFKFTLSFNSGNAPREVIANMLKRSVESINPKFKIDTRAIQWSTYLDQSNASKLPMFVLGWAPDYPDAHNFAHPFMHSQGNYPRLQRYKNAEADRLVTQAMGETDPGKRAKLYHRLQAIAHEDAHTLFVLDSVSYRTQRSWLKGFQYNPVWPDSPYLSPFYSLWKE